MSHSAIWPYTAVFIIQDDAQDGADHVEGHRITSFVASPYARRGAVVSTHYDTVSVIRTIELILGMKPTYMYDALARPMWEAFQSTPNTGPFGRVDMPESLMEEKNGQNAPMAKTSARYVWVADAVPENVMNQLDWAYRYGTARACPHRVGRIPRDPCESDGSVVARKEIAKGRATVAALRRLYARGGR